MRLAIAAALVALCFPFASNAGSSSSLMLRGRVPPKAKVIWSSVKNKYRLHHNHGRHSVRIRMRQHFNAVGVRMVTVTHQ